MHRHVWAIGLLSLAAMSGSGQTSCISGQGYTYGAAATIGVHIGPGWAANNKDAPPVDSALAMWSSGCPNMQGSDFPAFVAGTAGDLDVTVEFMTGFMPQANEPDACARFVPQQHPQTSVLIGGTGANPLRQEEEKTRATAISIQRVAAASPIIHAAR